MSTSLFLGPLFGAIEKIADVIGLVEAKAPLERIRKIKMAIMEERGRGDEADQAKIAALYKQLDLEEETAASLIQAGVLSRVK